MDLASRLADPEKRTRELIPQGDGAHDGAYGGVRPDNATVARGARGIERFDSAGTQELSAADWTAFVGLLPKQMGEMDDA